MSNTRLDGILIRGYKEDFEKQTGRCIRVEVCNKWQSIANVTDKGNFWAIIKLILDYTGWEWKSTFTKRRDKEPVFRRSIIDYICLNNGITTVEVARETDRDHTTVMSSAANMDSLLSHDYYTQKAFREIANDVVDNYYLYKDKHALKDDIIGGVTSIDSQITKVVLIDESPGESVISPKLIEVVL